MKNNIILTFLFAILMMTSCKKSEFEEYYPDPSKIAESTIERQYTGIVVAANQYIVPNYRNYFVTLRQTLNPWNNAISVINSSKIYIPGSSGTEDVWFNYYNTMAQYREFQLIYNEASPEDQANRAIFDISARVFMAYYTQRMVDLFENIPYFDAGSLSANGGDYNASFATFDSGEEIYADLITDLKSAADELNALNISDSYRASFATQDIINNGDILLWKKLTNSLRLRVLNRVKDASGFGSAAGEINEILSNPSKYPVIETNEENAMIDVYDIDSGINSKGFRDGINSDGWDGNDANKNMIDMLVASKDARLRVLFEPAEADSTNYRGLDPLLPSGDQSSLVDNGMISQYNRSTMSNNQSFPGLLISAAEVDFIKAEIHHLAGNDSEAKTSYENGIKNSTEFYYYVRTLSGDQVAGTSEPWTEEELSATMSSPEVSWDSNSDKMKIIATQKWLHFNIIQPYESWAEQRRLDQPKFEYWVDQNSEQPQPPVRWTIPINEQTYNPDNYNAVKADDGLNNPLFWDS